MGLVEAALCCSRYSPCSVFGNVVGSSTLPQQEGGASRLKPIGNLFGGSAHRFKSPQETSFPAYGFLEVFISMRSGVPTRSNSLRKRASRKRLYASVTCSSELPC